MVEEGFAELEAITPDDDGAPTQASRLVTSVISAGVELWADARDEAWATMRVDNHRENWPVTSSRFRSWLGQLYYRTTGRAPSTQTVRTAADTLAGRGLYAGVRHSVHVRIARVDGTIYLDLCDPEWRVVRITNTGWQLTADAPVRFRRPGGADPLPVPVAGGSIELLWAYLNVAEGDRPLILGWLLCALRGEGPYPIAVLGGDQGSAKSTTTKLLRALIDPNRAALRSMPKSDRDLMIAATNSAVIALDNLSYISGEMSDALCRVATRGGMATRKLYTDDDEAIFDVCRPVIINGITDVAKRPDLLDRSFVLRLPAITPGKRRLEQDYWSSFARDHPHLLGTLLELLTKCLALETEVELSSLPRLADAARWMVAAEPATGWAPGTFLEAMRTNHRVAVDIAVEASPLIDPVLKLVDRNAQVSLQPTRLLVRLEEIADIRTVHERGWPKTASMLSQRLRGLSATLRELGVEVVWGHTSEHRPQRLITLTRVPAADAADGADDGPGTSK